MFSSFACIAHGVDSKGRVGSRPADARFVHHRGSCIFSYQIRLDTIDRRMFPEARSRSHSRPSTPKLIYRFAFAARRSKISHSDSPFLLLYLHKKAHRTTRTLAPVSTFLPMVIKRRGPLSSSSEGTRRTSQHLGRSPHDVVASQEAYSNSESDLG